VSRDYSKYINRPGYKAPKGYNPEKYFRPSVAVDLVIFSFFSKKLWILLIQRKNQPFQGYWAFPGGFVEKDEDLKESAQRELFEETGLKNPKLIEFGSFGHPLRDPRTRVISIAYLALVRKDKVKPKAGDDAKLVGWFPARKPPELAFDHELILKSALERLKELCLLKPALFDLLPPKFSAEELQGLCSEIYRKKYDSKKLLRKFLSQGLISAVGKNKYQFKRLGFSACKLSFLIANK